MPRVPVLSRLHNLNRSASSHTCDNCEPTAEIVVWFVENSCCLFRIGQPLSGTQELHDLFSRYDINNSGQLEFNEFLVLFKDRLTDVQKTLEYISLKPAKSKSTEPSVLEVRHQHALLSAVLVRL